MSQVRQMDRQEEPLAEDEVDLMESRHLVACQRVEDDVEDIANGLGFRPCIALDDILDDDRMDIQCLRDRVHLLRRWVGKVFQTVVSSSRQELRQVLHRG